MLCKVRSTHNQNKSVKAEFEFLCSYNIFLIYCYCANVFINRRHSRDTKHFHKLHMTYIITPFCFRVRRLVFRGHFVLLWDVCVSCDALCMIKICLIEMLHTLWTDSIILASNLPKTMHWLFLNFSGKIQRIYICSVMSARWLEIQQHLFLLEIHSTIM